MTTRKCANCHKIKFEVDPLAQRPYPGLCDKCAIEREESEGDEWGDKIRALPRGGFFVVDATPQTPRPWEALEAEVKRARWAGFSLRVEQVHAGYGHGAGAVVRRYAPGFTQLELFTERSKYEAE